MPMEYSPKVVQKNVKMQHTCTCYCRNFTDTCNKNHITLPKYNEYCSKS